MLRRTVAAASSSCDSRTVRQLGASTLAVRTSPQLWWVREARPVGSRQGGAGRGGLGRGRAGRGGAGQGQGQGGEGHGQNAPEVHGDPPISRALCHAASKLARGAEAAAEGLVEDAVVEQLAVGPRHVETEDEDSPRRVHRARRTRHGRRTRHTRRAHCAYRAYRGRTARTAHCAYRARTARTAHCARRARRAHTAAIVEAPQHTGQRASGQAVRAVPEGPTRLELSAGAHELRHVRLPNGHRPEPSARKVVPDGGAVAGGVAEAEEVGVVRAVDCVVELTDPPNASGVRVDQARLLELEGRAHSERQA